MKLFELVRALGGRLEGDGATDILDVQLDSRCAREGVLFSALPGTKADGARFAIDATQRGAAAVLVPRAFDFSVGVPLWTHPDARRVTGLAAALVHGEPVREQRVIGVTGTNGKSTVAHLVGQLLTHVGHRPGVIGTVEYKLWNAPARPSTHTTPDAPELNRLARANRELGGDSFALEVSSHALDQERLAGFPLDVAIFTNLGRDHLDYHSDLEAYARAKERIFEHLKAGGAALINADDVGAERMRRAAERNGARVFTYGTRSNADLSATLEVVGPSGTTLFLDGMGIPRTGYFLPLTGRHNVENALAALAAVLFLGASPATAVAGLASLTAPRGRLEPVDTGARGFQVFVDYAHTPDALERVLSTLREFLLRPAERRVASGRLICVFGCGGNRDREKRAPMGRAVARQADLCVVTSDNPRDEDPRAIIEDILPGLEHGRAAVEIEPDRRKAIARALASARAGDIVLIAGKGHETWQQVRDTRLSFEDPLVVQEELR
ncbi:MAG: UDP-N-acetylmuramoyl-L-alanyl-D-glutamate--2,6-diaminopimelate ligase [Planctomycetes bacterium]|nr:UDP-N-acetylmuramoyl-L-alanyl-D-glutamate--2,6-diaminopimelate ligase [Planctomycetota bacterium]